MNGAGANYTYYLGDNLGNTRVTFETKTGSAVQIQRDDYYAFGMEINSQLPTPPTAKNEYLYNKKELQEETQQYDYGARFYDPVIGRWSVVDAYAEHPDQIDLSPYVYVGNNPIIKTDPDGNCPPCDVPANDNLFDRIVHPPTDQDRIINPTKDIIHRAAYNLLDGIGIKGLINPQSGASMQRRLLGGVLVTLLMIHNTSLAR